MDKNIAIRVENVSKTFIIPHEKVSSLRGAFTNVFTRSGKSEEFKALDNVSFEVKKGEFFGIIGRNGSGKSTLLKVIAGIYNQDKGKVHTNGMVAPFLELGIGFNPELSGRDNVYLNASVLGLTKKQIDKKFDDIVKFSELERFIDQKLKNYSSGMQVRLAFSVSIHANRDILLMDEVLAVGDSNFQSKCLEEFAKYRDMGRTVILVTHDIGTVERYCDRAMLVRNGKIMKIGSAKDVASEYVYENMSDEERRMVDEEKAKIGKDEKDLKKLHGKALSAEKARIELEKKKQEEDRKNKVAEITKVEFLDKNGHIKNVFETGEDVIARVYFKVLNKNKDIFNFGFGLYNLRDQYLFGISTIADKINTAGNVDREFFDVHLKNVNLLNDSYYIKASIVGVDFTGSSVFDFIEKSKYFKMVSPNINEGVIAFDYSWK